MQCGSYDTTLFNLKSYEDLLIGDQENFTKWWLNNDAFDISFLNVAKLRIFNRYGLLVYERAAYTNQWYGQDDNGHELPVGTYLYYIT